MSCEDNTIKKVEDTLQPRQNGKGIEEVVTPPQPGSKELRTLGEFAIHQNKQEDSIPETTHQTKTDTAISETIHVPKQDTPIETPLFPSKKHDEQISTLHYIPTKKSEEVTPPAGAPSKNSPEISTPDQKIKKEELVEDAPGGDKKQEVTLPNIKDPAFKIEQAITPKTEEIKKDDKIVEVDGILRNSRGEPVVELRDHIYKVDSGIDFENVHRIKQENIIPNLVKETSTHQSKINLPNAKEYKKIGTDGLEPKEEKDLGLKTSHLHKNETVIKKFKPHPKKKETVIASPKKYKKSEKEIKTTHKVKEKIEKPIDSRKHLKKKEVGVSTLIKHYSKSLVDAETRNENLQSDHKDKTEIEATKHKNLKSIHKEKLDEGDPSYYDANDETKNNTRISNNRLNYTYDQVLETIMTSIHKSPKTDEDYTFTTPSPTNTQRIIDDSGIPDQNKGETAYAETETGSIENLPFSNKNHVVDYDIDKLRTYTDPRIPFKANDAIDQNVVPQSEENVTAENFQRKDRKNPKQEIAIFSDNVAPASTEYLEAEDSTKEPSDYRLDYNKIFTQYTSSVTPGSISQKVADAGTDLTGAKGRMRGEEQYNDVNLTYNSGFKPGFDALNLIPPRQGLLDSIAMGLRTFDIMPKIPIPKTDSFNDTFLRILAREGFTQVGQVVFSRLHSSTLMGNPPEQAAEIQADGNSPELSSAIKGANWVDGVINAIATFDLADIGKAVGGWLGFKYPQTDDLIRGFIPSIMKNQISRSAGHIFKNFYNYQLAVKIYGQNYILKRTQGIGNEVTDINKWKSSVDQSIAEMERTNKDSWSEDQAKRYEELQASKSAIAWRLDQLQGEEKAIKRLKSWFIQIADPIEYQIYDKNNFPKNIPYWHINMMRGRTGAIGDETPESQVDGKTPKNTKYENLNWRELAATTKPRNAENFDPKSQGEKWLFRDFNPNMGIQQIRREEAYRETDFIMDVPLAAIQDFTFTYLIFNDDTYGKSYKSNFDRITYTDDTGALKVSKNPREFEKDSTEELGLYNVIKPYNDIMKKLYDKRDPAATQKETKAIYKNADKFKGNLNEYKPEDRTKDSVKEPQADFKDPHLLSAAETVFVKQPMIKDYFFDRLLETYNEKNSGSNQDIKVFSYYSFNDNPQNHSYLNEKYANGSDNNLLRYTTIIPSSAIMRSVYGWNMFSRKNGAEDVTIDYSDKEEKDPHRKRALPTLNQGVRDRFVRLVLLDKDSKDKDSTYTYFQPVGKDQADGSGDKYDNGLLKNNIISMTRNLILGDNSSNPNPLTVNFNLTNDYYKNYKNLFSIFDKSQISLKGNKVNLKKNFYTVFKGQDLPPHGGLPPNFTPDKNALLVDDLTWSESDDTKSNQLFKDLSLAVPSRTVPTDTHATPTNGADTKQNISQVKNAFNDAASGNAIKTLTDQMTEIKKRTGKVAQVVSSAVNLDSPENITLGAIGEDSNTTLPTPIEIFASADTVDRGQRKNKPTREQGDIGSIIIVGADTIPLQFNPEISGESRSSNWNSINSFGRGSEYFIWSNSGSRQIQFKTTYAVLSDDDIPTNDVTYGVNPHYAWAQKWTEVEVLHCLNLYRSLVNPTADGYSPPFIKIKFNEMTISVNGGNEWDTLWVVGQYDIAPNLDCGYTKNKNPRIYDVTLDLKEIYGSWSGWQSVWSFTNHKNQLTSKYKGKDKGKP